MRAVECDCRIDFPQHLAVQVQRSKIVLATAILQYDAFRAFDRLHNANRSPVLCEAQRIVKETNMNGFAMGGLDNWMYLCYRDEDEIGAYVDVMFTRLDGEGKGALPPAGKETPAPEENPSAEETPAPAPFHTPAPTDKPVHKA